MMTSRFTSLPSQKPCRTKIVATIGPASSSEEMIAELIEAGVDVFRINFAHGNPETHADVLNRIRQVSEEMHQPIAVLADLAGPKMRLGEIPNNEYECRTGEFIRFVRGIKTDKPDCFTSTYEPLIDDLKLGDRVLLADGIVELRVRQKDPVGVECEVIQGGVIRSRQGINLPGVKLSVAALLPHDIENAKWATKMGIDFLGLSFVRSPNDIVELRTLLEETAKELHGENWWNHHSATERSCCYPNIIAKIEKPETLDCLEEIVAVSDGIMVARGDLGVEVAIEKIAILQKQIIETCHRHTKPVIVATQMLESMIKSSIPTRAEATDVANAILDGTDACMLSGETAVGAHPVLAVEMMNRIAHETENALIAQKRAARLGYDVIAGKSLSKENLPEDVKVSIAVCDAAATLADQIDATIILVATKTGRTALNFSKMRNCVMTVGTSQSEVVLRRLCLYWGVIPVGGIPNNPSQMLETFLALATKPKLLHSPKVGKVVAEGLITRATSKGSVDGEGGTLYNGSHEAIDGEGAKTFTYLKPGDRIVLTAGIGVAGDNRNAIYVHTVLDSNHRIPTELHQ